MNSSVARPSGAAVTKMSHCVTLVYWVVGADAGTTTSGELAGRGTGTSHPISPIDAIAKIVHRLMVSSFCAAIGLVKRRRHPGRERAARGLVLRAAAVGRAVKVG